MKFFSRKKRPELELFVTLWPTFPHFGRFANDERLRGIRLNSAMTKCDTLNDELNQAKAIEEKVPLYFDIKGRQLRVADVSPNKDHLELRLNHKIDVEAPCVVLFKAGTDRALLKKVVDGDYLIFEGGPNYMIEEGESLQIRNSNLYVHGPLFTDVEIDKIQKARDAGFDRFVLSYVESSRDISEFREYVGDSEIIGKIESKKGLEYVANDFRKQDNYSLMTARGDLYVEIDKPHDILKATKMIIEKDPYAMVGSRMILSVINQSVPECSDFCEIAWLYDIGYNRFMLCDGLCLEGNALGRAINVFEGFKSCYAN